MKLKALLFAGLLVAGMSIGLVACGQANKASVSASNSGSSATQGTSSSEAIRIGVPDDGTNLSRGIKFTALPFNAHACGVLRDWRGHNS